MNTSLTKKQIFSYFLIWRFNLFIVSYLAIIVLPVFGGRFPYSQELLASNGFPSWVWGFGNFDGVHYITIAEKGYVAQFTQAFFPLYPFLISVFSLGKYYFLSGLAISNILFLAALIMLNKLWQLDVSNKVTQKSILLLLAFPTAFYFGSIYSESLFLFFTVLALFFIRKQHFITSGFFIALASITRLFGIFLLPVLLIESFLHFKNKKEITSMEKFRILLSIAIASLGILSYMYYLKLTFNDPIYFINAQPYFGAARTAGEIVLIPQVVFRYLKIFISVSWDSLLFFNALLEFSFTIWAFLLLVFTFKKIRASYWVFSLICIIVPTLTGTFSSMPRYVLMCFLLIPFVVMKINNRFIYATVILILVVLQLILVSLFTRGYWIA